ncbi:MAG: hypothetical protein ABSF95_23475 [Verrucomicrobiota bacterium]|jgi:hypothetical protein
MAGPAHEDLAADAAAYLARSGNTVESFGGSPEEIDRQAACLVEWAKQRKAFLTEAHTAGLKKHSETTAEHEVFYRQSDDRAVKRTYPGTFGVTPEPKGVQKHATPAFYLQRLDLMNRVFHSDLRLEGVALGRSLLIGAKGEQPSMVISQPWIRAADPSRPHPSRLEIAEFMESLGFTRQANAYYGWHRKEDGISIIDARPDNFVKSPEGVVPIGLVISAGHPAGLTTIKSQAKSSSEA